MRLPTVLNVAYLQKTTLPYEDNYLDLDPVVKDPMGFPVIRIAAEYKDNEKRIGVFVQDKVAQWFMEAGAIVVEKGPTGIMGPRPTPMGAPAWATTARLMWSTALAFPMRCRTSESSGPL
jgi:hypothetical protein